MRDQLKCYECRRKKIKCTPRTRDWETTREKCDNCKKHDDTPCGPNCKSKDDPTFSGNRDGVTTHEVHIRDAGDQPRATSPASDEESDELRKVAASLLRKLNSFGRSHDLGLQLRPVHCRARDNPIKYNKEPESKMEAIRDEFHLLYMKTCHIGFQLCEKGMDNDADRVFKKLMFVLKKHPRMGDDRKKGALQKMASFYLKVGDQDEREWLLMKATEAAEAYGTAVHQDDPCQLLAEVFIETSETTNHDLHEFWNRHFMLAVEPSLAIPPIPRSAQHNNAGIASILSAPPNSVIRSPPGLFNQEGLHIAATSGNEQILTSLLHARAEVDAPDIHNHSALFLAAANGHEGCCAELLKCGADPNRRNFHGTTILEVAAAAGHLRVVQQLVKAGAKVNPEIVCCASSPLQAAIESPESPLEVALYLMGVGGDVSTPRKDGMNAKALAERKNKLLAKILGQKERLGPQSHLDQPQVFSFDHSDLDFDASPL